MIPSACSFGRALQMSSCRNFIKVFKNSSKQFSTQYFHVDDQMFGFTNEEMQMRETIFNFAQKELAPKAEEIDKMDHFDDIRGFWKKLGELGTLGITVGTEFGGSGGSYLDHVIIIEEISRASAAIGLSYAAQSNFVGNQLNSWGSVEQKKKYLPQICTGEIIGALALSEPWAGSDVVGMKTTARKDGDHYILNGTKLWITNGPIADIIIVYAKTDLSAGSHGITAFLVETKTEGFSVGKKLDKLGMRGSDTGELIFEDVRVHESNILGEKNKGIYICFKGLDTERVILAGASVGIMQAACDVAFEYVHKREQFGKAIGTNQLMQGKLADMYVALCSSKSLLYNIARRLNNSVINPWETAGCFLLAAENSTKVCLEALQCLGANGYINSYPTGRLLRDSKLYEIGGGTSEIRRMVIGRGINDMYMKN